MEKLYQTDYKLDQRFLLNLIAEKLSEDCEESSAIELPVCVQSMGGNEELGEWSSFQFTDGEFEMCRCAFLSKQSLPECYSILKIKKITILPLDISDYIRDHSEDHDVQYLLGEIDFEIEVDGGEIGHPLYEIKPHKYLDMVEILARKDAIGVTNFLESLTFESPSIKLVKSMWHNCDETFCDVSFTFSDNQERKAFAHKSVLISVSDVFGAHFSRKDYRDGDSVHIVDTNFYYFNKLLEFIYTDNVQFTNLDVTFELLYLSKKYLLPNLEYQCQTTILMDHYNYKPASIFDLLTLNHKSSDKYVHDYLTKQIKAETRCVLNSEDFLKCDYATVEWILSMEDLHIDEWSILCALYKWAWHNEVNGFCDDSKDVVNVECLHGLLECIQFENIDGKSMQRFFRLPKLAKMINVGKLKQRAFESVLEDVSGFKHSFSTFRDSGFPTFSDSEDNDNYFYIEKTIKKDFVNNTEESSFNILHLKDGSVLSLKVRVGLDMDQPDDEYAAVVHTNFQYLCTNNNVIRNAINVKIGLRYLDCLWKGQLANGEQKDLKLSLSDYRDYLSDKIENVGVEDSSESEEKVLGFELRIISYEEDNSD